MTGNLLCLTMYPLFLSDVIVMKLKINDVADSTVVSNASVVADKESQGSKYDERQRLEKKYDFGPKIGVLNFHNNPL